MHACAPGTILACRAYQSGKAFCLQPSHRAHVVGVSVNEVIIRIPLPLEFQLSSLPASDDHSGHARARAVCGRREPNLCFSLRAEALCFSLRAEALTAALQREGTLPPCFVWAAEGAVMRLGEKPGSGARGRVRESVRTVVLALQELKLFAPGPRNEHAGTRFHRSELFFLRLLPSRDQKSRGDELYGFTVYR